MFDVERQFSTVSAKNGGNECMLYFGDEVNKLRIIRLYDFWCANFL